MNHNSLVRNIHFMRSREVNIFPVEVSVRITWVGKDYSLHYLVSKDFGLTIKHLFSFLTVFAYVSTIDILVWYLT